MARLGPGVINATRVKDSDLGRVVGRSLKALRELSGLTQAELAIRLGIGQAAVSKIERRGDVQISSLRKYVEALGATLRIDAAFEVGSHPGGKLEGAFTPGLSDDDQLVFPIFGDELFRPKRDVVISVKPVYSEKILNGTKTVELRRRFPIAAPRGTLAYIYASSPVRAIVGSAEIADVIKMSVLDIWKNFRQKARVTKSEFFEYFSGLDDGFVLSITNVRPFAKHINLSELRDRFAFEPPQSFLYASPILRAALNNEYSDLPDRHERNHRS